MMRRDAVITALDGMVIVLASAAVVIWLGGRAKFTVFDLRVLLLTPLRPALLAAGAAALRLLIAPRVRVLPSLTNRLETAAVDRGRALFVAPPPRPAALWRYAAAALVASLVWITPHLLHPRLVPDPGDPVFSAWRLGRFAQQLAHDPRHLFDGRIYYPAADTLTYSDATVLQGLVAAPFILAGADPLIVANVLFLAAFPLRALAFFYAGWRLTVDPRAALIAGILGALYPFYWEHYSHLELQFTFFIPLSIVAVLCLLAGPTVRRGVILGVLVTLQWLACMYFGVMLIAFLLPFAILVAIGWRARVDRALLKSVACALAVATAGFAVLALPYMRTRTARGERGVPFVAVFSAVPAEYAHPSGRLATYQWLSREQNRIEREMFPGLAVLALAAPGITPPLGTVAIALVSCGALAFDWSLGTNGLTYDDLYHWILPVRSMRVPARYSVFVGSVLVLLSACGSARVFSRSARLRHSWLVFAIVVTVGLMDLRADLKLVSYWRVAPSIYGSVTPEMVLAEFPFDHNEDYMYFSLTHGARLLNGYGGFVPGPYLDVQNALGSFPSATSLDALRQTGVTHITVNCRFYGSRCGRVLDGLETASGVRPVASGKWEAAEVRLYELGTTEQHGRTRH